MDAEQRDRLIRNEDLDEALERADRIRGYARPTVGEHAALRLAVEVRDQQARVADLNAEQAVAWHRVAELESAVRCTCNYAGMEGERHKDFCEIEGGPHVECQRRIAELESEVRQYREDMAAVTDALGASGVASTPGLLAFIAQQDEPTGTDWGVRWADSDGKVSLGGELWSRSVACHFPRAELVSRTLGPWRPAQ